MHSVIITKKYIESFTSLLENYEIIPEEERKLFDRKVAQVTDFGKRRDLKINQYKKEKDLQGRIETIRKRRGQKTATEDEQMGFGLISSLLPKPQAIQGEEDLDLDTEEILRETTLLVLRLFYARAMTQLHAMEQELELLRNAPPSPMMGPESGDFRDKQRNVDENDWKLDIPLAGSPDGKGPLMDAQGKPLRSFTILPSDAGERARLQAQVFAPGHRLPTMSIDEYLEIERQRGNIITGGGPASQAAPTSSDQLAIDAEMDGTLEGDLKEEMQRQKNENWARYTDANPRGAGNTMNRG